MTASTGPTPQPTSTPAGAEPGEAATRPPEGDLAAIEAVRGAFGDDVLATIVFRGETTLVVRRERIAAILGLLRDDPALRFDRLSDLTAVDYLDLEPGEGGQRGDDECRFAVVYQLMSRGTLARLRVRALVPEEDPVIASVVGLYPSANWLEREVYDMFGIGFAGHPDPTRILMPDDWEGHPLRKDFPIGAEAIDFSFNRQVVAASHPATLAEREERYKVDHFTLHEGGEDPAGRQ